MMKLLKDIIDTTWIPWRYWDNLYELITNEISPYESRFEIVKITYDDFDMDTWREIYFVWMINHKVRCDICFEVERLTGKIYIEHWESIFEEVESWKESIKYLWMALLNRGV